MTNLPNITPKEIAIIKKAQAGNILAFNKLFYQYKKFVDNILFGYLKDMDEAQDLTNIVFLKVFDKLSTFKDYSSFGGWLRIIANRTAIDYLRSKKTVRIAESEDNRLLFDVSDGLNEDDLVNQLTYNQILKELDQFSDQVRKVCKLYYIDNMTVQQIYEATGIPTGTVKSHLARTRRKLQKILKI